MSLTSRVYGTNSFTQFEDRAAVYYLDIIFEFINELKSNGLLNNNTAIRFRIALLNYIRDICMSRSICKSSNSISLKRIDSELSILNIHRLIIGFRVDLIGSLKVTQISSKSIASKFLKVGDIITKINNVDMNKATIFEKRLNIVVLKNETVAMEVLRDGKHILLNISE